VSTSASENKATVVGFYDTLKSKDPDKIEAFVTERFSPDIEFGVPTSLPYGGVIKGLPKVTRVVRSLTQSNSIIDPATITMERIVGDDDGVVVWLAFPWRDPHTSEVKQTGNFEWFTFDEQGRVTSLTAYYRDTAGLLVDRQS
jgi:ketosteroid isomerase-like protein